MSLNLDIDSLPPEKVEAAITRLEAMKAQRAAENKLTHYHPYLKQVAFHAAGTRCRERLLIAANQSGKSLAGAMHAQFGDGSVSVEAGLADMLIRMESGRFKVFKHLNEWFEEFRLYHRKDGRVHKEGDDLMSATRYAVMMLRYARTNIPPKPRMYRPYGGAGGWMAA